jgi:hypothetical protein
MWLPEQLAKQRFVITGMVNLAVGHTPQIDRVLGQLFLATIDFVDGGDGLGVAGAVVIAVEQTELHPRFPTGAKGGQGKSFHLGVFLSLAAGNFLADACVLTVSVRRQPGNSVWWGPVSHVIHVPRSSLSRAAFLQRGCGIPCRS